MLVCFLGFVSCEGEDDTNYVQKNYLSGMWNLTHVGALNASGILNYQEVSNRDCSDSYLFNEDLTASVTYRVTTSDACNSETVSGTYKIVNGNIELLLTGAETPMILDMLTLTDKELSFVYTSPSTSKLVFLKMSKAMPL